MIQFQFGNQKRLHDHHAFSMQVTAQLGLTLNVGKFTVAQMHHAADTGGFAKAARMPRVFQHGESVDLTDDFAFGFNQNLTQFDLILHPFGKVAFTPLARIQCGFKGFGRDAFFFCVQSGFRKLLADPQR
ncbi:hypothetical protein D3C79_703320 [compost metagenome]